MRSERRFVLGVPVDVVTEQDVLIAARDAASNHELLQIVTVNAEYVVKAQEDREFMSVLHGARLATADGAGVIWALRRQGVTVPRRVGGSDLIWRLCEQAAQFGHRVFLLGAAEGVAAAAADRLASQYPGLQIAGTYSGAPDEAVAGTIVDLVRRARADILFVAYGAPKQDIWIARYAAETGASVAMGVGGSFDYIAGRARRAPVWMQDHGLDWLWRLARQPWRARRMLALPRFVLMVLRERRSAATEVSE